jgi:hypothetical protein
MKLSWLVVLIAWALVVPAMAAEPSGLADATILIIRHAEKSPQSGHGLTPSGEARAAAYVGYFQTLALDGAPARPDTLVATADTKSSHRPRLTIEPLSRALGLPVDLRFKTRQVDALAEALRTEPHGRRILISWHHEAVPQLIQALGFDPTIIPGGRWPDDVYGWLVVLRYDHAGQPIPASAQLIRENLMPDDAASR